MPLFDWPLSQLREYRPALTREPDFDQFWQRTLDQATAPLEPHFTPADYPARGLSVFDVRYTGWNGARIAGWYIKPQGNGPFPALAIYHGYSGSRAQPHNHFPWVAQGYAVFAVDTRGQSGDSTDPAVYSSGHVKGWMTAGVLDKEEYYYRGAYIDCVRALDVLATRPEVDMARLGVTGGSQGGGLSLAVSALDPRPKACMADIPYLCHYERAVDLAALMPYLEISDYIKIYPQRERQVFRTLSYFDNMNLAPRNRSNVLMSVGLQDDCCPPSTIFAAYNHLTCNKELKIYRYHKHEDIPAHWAEKFAWAAKYV